MDFTSQDLIEFLYFTSQSAVMPDDTSVIGATSTCSLAAIKAVTQKLSVMYACKAKEHVKQTAAESCRVVWQHSPYNKNVTREVLAEKKESDTKIIICKTRDSALALGCCCQKVFRAIFWTRLW